MPKPVPGGGGRPLTPRVEGCPKVGFDAPRVEVWPKPGVELKPEDNGGGGREVPLNPEGFDKKPEVAVVPKDDVVDGVVPKADVVEGVVPNAEVEGVVPKPDVVDGVVPNADVVDGFVPKADVVEV